MKLEIRFKQFSEKLIQKSYYYLFYLFYDWSRVNIYENIEHVVLSEGYWLIKIHPNLKKRRAFYEHIPAIICTVVSLSSSEKSIICEQTVFEPKVSRWKGSFWETLNPQRLALVPIFPFYVVDTVVSPDNIDKRDINDSLFFIKILKTKQWWILLEKRKHHISCTFST